MTEIKDLFQKYNKSEDRWILIAPVSEKGQLKLRCFMSKKRNSDIFENVYTYNIGLGELLKFLNANSFGQAYNGIVKNKKKRIGFQTETDHEKGLFTKFDVLQTMIRGRTKLLLEMVTMLQSRYDLEANMNRLEQRKSMEQLELEFEAFYDY